MANCSIVSIPAITPSTSPVREFRCTWGECTKSFSRAEHLHRHALNHDESKGNFTCQRCMAVFRRKDLLDRHMVRHKEKDDEAGGEGLGKLQTRKRLWRDSNGAVVSKRRPEHEKKSTSVLTGRKISRSQVSRTRLMHYFSNEKKIPISPPGSLRSHSSTGPGITAPSEVFYEQSTQDLWSMNLSDDTFVEDRSEGADSYGFLSNASWGLRDQERMVVDLPNSDLFAPDTASSFNMPFTTSSYYNWLFGKEGWAASDSIVTNSVGETSLNDFSLSTPKPPSFIPREGELRGILAGLEEPRNIQEGSIFDIKASNTTSTFWNPFFVRETQSPETSAANQILAMAKMAESTVAASLGYHYEPSPAFSTQMMEYIPTPATSASSQNDQLSIGQSRQDRRFPNLDEVSRERILEMINRARPKTPDETEITRDHPLLSLTVLQNYCDLYFQRFNKSYPLLHQATFDPAHVDPLLLTSVLLLGATYSNKESHLFAICIHDVMRAQILSSAAFSTRPTLWMLQTILLVECFGKSRAGQLQHDMSHLFHGLLINLIRRSDCQSARCESFGGLNEIDLEQRWRAEVDAEQRRRLALLCFMWDTQHAVLFSQSLCMTAAELKLTLPWNEAFWDADSAEQWYKLYSIEPPQPLFLSVLKSYMNPSSEIQLPHLNPLSRVLMLHGLMSVAWDLGRRDQTSLGIAVTSRDEPWQSRLARSYDAWKLDFDAYTADALLLLADDPDKEAFQKFCTASLVIYHAAHIILHVEIIDLQIFAGASHIIGRPVTKVDYDRSQRRIESWAKNGSLPAAKASFHAARILRDGIRRLRNWDAGDYFHYPWCLYLATLTCWSFQMCCKSDLRLEDGLSSDNDEEGDLDSRAEMNALVSAMAKASIENLWKVAGKYRTGDLPRVMVKHLSTIRWAIVQEGMIVLRGLGKGSKLI